MKLAIAAILIFMGSSPLVFGSTWDDFTSVWAQSSTQQLGVEGTVKSIIVDEESDRFLVRIQRENGSEEILHLCHEGVQSARNQNVYKSAKMGVLQGALSTGKPVVLTPASTFDRCIEEAALSPETKNI